MEPSKLVALLANHWSFWELHKDFYIQTLAPQLVENPDCGDEVERKILRELRSQVSQSEWATLPQRIEWYKSGALRLFECEIAAEAERREVAKAEAMRRQLEAEAEAMRRQLEAEQRYLEEKEKRIREKAQIEIERQEFERQRVFFEILQKEEEVKREIDRQASEREDLHHARINLQVILKKIALIKQIKREMQHDFLNADAVFKLRFNGILSDNEYNSIKTNFVREWFECCRDSCGKSSVVPDDEQIAAIAAVNGNVQVVARAGSGKTATIVHRTFFLLKHCKVLPSSILLLAFNRKAASEIRRRLLALLHPDGEMLIGQDVEKRHADAKRRQFSFKVLDAQEAAINSVTKTLRVELPHAMTFHALAYAIVRPEGDFEILFNEGDPQNQTLNREFQSVIDAFRRNRAQQDEIRKLMLARFREDWERIIDGKHDLPRDEFLSWRRSAPRETLKGINVKSWGEKLIADFLFEHNIAFGYERNHGWQNGVNRSTYRPDFTILKSANSGVIIEYFGMVGDPDYDEMSERKREFWKNKPEWEFIEFSPKDIALGRGVFCNILEEKLKNLGFILKRLSEDEIWLRVKNRAIDQFTKVMSSFVGRCRKLSLSPDALQQLLSERRGLSQVEEDFCRIGHSIYRDYLEHLAVVGKEDFDGLMQLAADSIRGGNSNFHRKAGSGNFRDLKFLFVDEFQDFSNLFYKLIQGIRECNPELGLFCVGDNWQAINGYAGSDLRYFNGFKECFGEFTSLYISTNYRSGKSIVNVGNALMKGMGKAATTSTSAEGGNVSVADFSSFQPVTIEVQEHAHDSFTPMVYRLVRRSLLEGSDVVLLCRTRVLPYYIKSRDGDSGNSLDSFLSRIRSLFPQNFQERITGSTAHSFKGLEGNTVILLDALAMRFPLIHPDWIFFRIFGDSPSKIEDEERRLFYVALTRAKHELIIVTESHRQSPFLQEIRKEVTLKSISWNLFPPGPISERPMHLIVRVASSFLSPSAGGTKAIKDLLKACGYIYGGRGMEWWSKPWQACNFSVATIQNEVWATDADGVAVLVFGEDERQVFANFLINKGKWFTVLDNLSEATVSVPDGEDWLTGPTARRNGAEGEKLDGPLPGTMEVSEPTPRPRPRVPPQPRQPKGS